MVQVLVRTTQCFECRQGFGFFSPIWPHLLWNNIHTLSKLALARFWREKQSRILVPAEKSPSGRLGSPMDSEACPKVTGGVWTRILGNPFSAKALTLIFKLNWNNMRELFVFESSHAIWIRLQPYNRALCWLGALAGCVSELKVRMTASTREFWLASYWPLKDHEFEPFNIDESFNLVPWHLSLKDPEARTHLFDIRA